MQSDRLGSQRNWADIPVSVRLLPIIVFQLYLWLTTLLFAYGPWPWPVDNALELYAFLSGAYISLGMGYLSGFAGRSSIAGSDKSDFKMLVRLSMALSVLLYFPTVFSRTGSFLPDVYQGIFNPGDAYTNAVDLSSAGGAFIYVEYLRIVIAPLTALAIPITVFSWGLWSRGFRLMVVILMLSSVALYMAMGTNKAVADFALTLPCLVLLGYYSRGIQISKTGWFKILAICSLFLIIMSIYFSVGQAQRDGSGVAAGYFGTPLEISTDRNQAYFEVLPAPLALFYEAISRYVCQGYYALSLALKMPFEPTFGLGHSMFLQANSGAWFGLEEVIERSYPARLETYYGWGVYELWDSAYVWIASDVGFIGTLMVVFFIGRWLCLSWRDAITVRDPLASVVFYFLIVALFYIPANNQIMQNGESFVGFYSILVWWLLRRNGVVLVKRRLAYK